MNRYCAIKIQNRESINYGILRRKLRSRTFIRELFSP